jgi:predicted restriction endonuclease
VLIDAAIERLYALNVGVIGVGGERHERPHKPLLLLAAFDLIDECLATPDHIPCSGASMTVAGIRFSARYIRSCDLTVASSTPPPAHVADDHPTKRTLSRQFAPAKPVAATGSRRRRRTAFRRLILDIYDHQCAACGLRIKLPAGNDVSFIDAAHLVPFAESHNDHPTNGLALCKNHHWAMDRDLIAPCPDLSRHSAATPDHRWKVAKVIDPRRSNGEKELHALDGKSLLLPQDQAFHPDSEGLSWRLERLIA